MILLIPNMVSTGLFIPRTRLPQSDNGEKQDVESNEAGEQEGHSRRQARHLPKAVRGLEGYETHQVVEEGKIEGRAQHAVDHVADPYGVVGCRPVCELQANLAVGRSPSLHSPDRQRHPGPAV